MNLAINKIEEIFTIEVSSQIEKYYISTLPDILPFTIHGEELMRSSCENVYIPQWIKIDKIQNINLLPEQLKNYLIELFKKYN